MKKVLFVMISLWSLTICAQKVQLDQIGPDGRHQVMTSMKNFSLEGYNYSMTLMAYESTNDVEWRLVVSSFNNIPNDNILLLKLKNEQTINLVVDSLREESYRTNSVTLQSRYVGVTQSGVIKTYYVSESCIKTEDLDSIETYGISKIRLGNSNNFHEAAWTDNQLGKYLTKCRKKIKEKLQVSGVQDNKKGTIYDGF